MSTAQFLKKAIQVLFLGVSFTLSSFMVILINNIALVISAGKLEYPPIVNILVIFIAGMDIYTGLTEEFRELFEELKKHE